MSLEYDVRYPLSEKITEADIKNSAREWIEGSRWYKFTKTNFPPEEKEGTLIQVGEGKTAWFKHFEYRKEEAGHEAFYYGYRLETTDTDNQKWRAEAVFQLEPGNAWMYIKNACYINDLKLPAKPMGGSRYPRIIRVLYEKGLFAKDNAFTIGEIHHVSQLKEENIKIIKKILEERQRLELPIICFHVRGSQNWKETIEKVTSDYVRRTAHVFLCMDEEDDKIWRKITSDLEWVKDDDSTSVAGSLSSFELLLPQNYTYFKCYFPEKDSDYSLVDQVMDSIMRISLFQSADSPDWNWLHLQNSVMPLNGEVESYHIQMNEAMAARLQEARKQHHLTQGDLAELTGCKMILISRLERLQTRKVKRELIHDIEKALGLEKNELARLENSRKEGAQEPATVNNAVMADIQSGDAGMTVDRSDNSGANPDKQETSGQMQTGAAHFCHMCGTLLKPDSRFCHNCGTRIN